MFSFSPVSCILRLTILAASATLLSLTSTAQCPPKVGNDVGCGSVITITDTGATVKQTGQGPYDGSDDTLVGIINNGKVPITSLILTSGFDIFGFDGDGINTFGIPGNPKDSTGYGGPN